MERLGERLARELWYCFAAKNLRRMVQFAQAFADAEIVASLMRQLSWTHVLQFLPFKTEPARRYSNAGCQRQETVQKPAPKISVCRSGSRPLPTVAPWFDSGGNVPINCR